MNMFTKALAVLALFSSLAHAQFDSAISDARWRKVAETPFVNVPAVEWATSPTIQIGAFQLQRPSKLHVAVEFKAALQFENQSNAVMTSYVTGSGVNLGLGIATTQVCSNICGGALGATDGQQYECPIAEPVTCMDVGSGLDHHVLVVNGLATRDVGFVNNGVMYWAVVPAGTHPITAQVYTGTQEVNGENVSVPTHIYWRSQFLYFRVKATVYAQ